MKIHLRLIGLLLLMCSSTDVELYAQKIIFTPHWVIQSQYAGFYIADSLGYYKEEGLDVEIIHPTTTEGVLLQLKDGVSHIITSKLSHALTFNSTGERLVNVMQLAQHNSLMLVSRTPLKDLSSLKNQKVAVWSYIDPKLLELINMKSNLNIEWIKFNSGVNLFLSEAVDIILVSQYDEFHTLKQCGVHVRPDQIFRLADHGYTTPEEGVYVTREYYYKNKESIDKFVRASIRGWKWAEENREETITLVMEKDVNNSVATNRYHQMMMLNDILDVHVNLKTRTRTYSLDEDSYNKAIRFYSPILDGVKPKFQNFVK